MQRSQITWESVVTSNHCVIHNHLYADLQSMFKGFMQKHSQSDLLKSACVPTALKYTLQCFCSVVSNQAIKHLLNKITLTTFLGKQKVK